MRAAAGGSRTGQEPLEVTPDEAAEAQQGEGESMAESCSLPKFVQLYRGLLCSVPTATSGDLLNFLDMIF